MEIDIQDQGESEEFYFKVMDYADKYSVGYLNEIIQHFKEKAHTDPVLYESIEEEIRKRFISDIADNLYVEEEISLIAEKINELTSLEY